MFRWKIFCGQRNKFVYTTCIAFSFYAVSFGKAQNDVESKTFLEHYCIVTFFRQMVFNNVSHSQ